METVFRFSHPAVRLGTRQPHRETARLFLQRTRSVRSSLVLAAEASKSMRDEPAQMQSHPTRRLPIQPDVSPSNQTFSLCENSDEPEGFANSNEPAGLANSGGGTGIRTPRPLRACRFSRAVPCHSVIPPSGMLESWVIAIKRSRVCRTSKTNGSVNCCVCFSMVSLESNPLPQRVQRSRSESQES